MSREFNFGTCVDCRVTVELVFKSSLMLSGKERRKVRKRSSAQTESLRVGSEVAIISFRFDWAASAYAGRLHNCGAEKLQSCWLYLKRSHSSTH
jgi:hypothetical protein